MTNFYFMRHGKVSGPPALYGHTDVCVSPSINDDILAKLTSISTSFDRVITSPLTRCSSIASLFSSRKNIPLIPIDSLKEISFGEVDGLAFAEHEQHWPDFERFWQDPHSFRFKNSESLTHFRARITTLFTDLCQQYQDESILVVCHGGVIRMILATVLDIAPNTPKLFSHLRINNARITHIEHTTKTNFTQVHGINLPIHSLDKTRQNNET